MLTLNMTTSVHVQYSRNANRCLFKIDHHRRIERPMRYSAAIGVSPGRLHAPVQLPASARSQREIHRIAGK